MVRQLERAPDLSQMPLIVVTAGILQDRWLRTVPRLEARAQARLALIRDSECAGIVSGTIRTV
jgi:hypothetical protein